MVGAEAELPIPEEAAETSAGGLKENEVVAAGMLPRSKEDEGAAVKGLPELRELAGLFILGLARLSSVDVRVGMRLCRYLELEAKCICEAYPEYFFSSECSILKKVRGHI